MRANKPGGRVCLGAGRMAVAPRTSCRMNWSIRVPSYDSCGSTQRRGSLVAVSKYSARRSNDLAELAEGGEPVRGRVGRGGAREREAGGGVGRVAGLGHDEAQAIMWPRSIA